MAALSPYATGEVRTTGSDANGGVFDSTSTGTDYSQQDTAQLSLGDIVTNGTATVSSVTGGFTAAMVGNGINIAGKTYLILTRVDSNNLTVSTNSIAAYPAAATGQTGKIGGAWASPGYAAGQMVPGNWLWIQGGTYVMTTNTNNVSDGYCTWAGGLIAGREMRVQGYTSTRGDVPDYATPPVIFKAGVNGTYLMQGAPGLLMRFILLDGQESIYGLVGMDVGGGRIENCWVTRCMQSGFSGVGWAIKCCGTLGRNGAACLGVKVMADCFCETQSNQTGFQLMDGGTIERCFVSGNGYNAGMGSNGAMSGGIIEGCVFYNCTSYVGNPALYVGFAGAQRTWKIKDCIFLSCDLGITSAATESAATIDHCAFYGNTTDIDTSKVYDVTNKVSLAANPFSSLTFGNIKLTTAGAAALYAAGVNFPSSWLASTPAGGSTVILMED